MLRIGTRNRSGDWIAWDLDNPGTWEAAKTETEAIGQLIITLATAWNRVTLEQFSKK